jgi:dTDP-4-dehydrorhamnose reductase
VGVYGKTKREGEVRVLEANTEALILRTNFFGWSRDHTTGILDFFTNSFGQGRAITGFRDYQVSSAYMGDVVDALVGLLTREEAGVFHVVSGDSLSKYDFGVAVAEVFGLDHSAMAKGLLSDSQNLASRGRNLTLHTQKVEAVLGREMPTSVEGLHRAKAERKDVMDYFGVQDTREARL